MGTRILASRMMLLQKGRPLVVLAEVTLARNLNSSSSLPRKTNPSLPNLATKEEFSQKTAIKKKFFQRMLGYLETYGDKVLANVLPKVAYDAVKTFSKGTKLLLEDMKVYNWSNHVLSNTRDWQRACKSLSRRQLEVYMHLPGELLRVAPVLVVSAFPFAQNVVFPLAMMYPNYLLSSHFLTEAQKDSTHLERCKSRQSYYVSIMHDLQRLVRNEKPSTKIKRAFGFLLKDRIDLKASDLLQLQNKFEAEGPYDLNKLNAPHIKHLLKIHGLRGLTLWFPRFRLQQHANLLNQIDLAILREGGPETMSLEELKQSCHLRGLNVDGLEPEDMVKYIEHWVEMSSKLTTNTMSLLLHAPVLLGYNHKSRIWSR